MNRNIILSTIFVTAALTLSACQNNAPDGAPAIEAADQLSPAPETDMVLDFGDRFSNVTGNVISVNSRETVNVVPDIAQVVYSVRTEAQTAADCQRKNGESVSSVISGLIESGVDESSIQTSDFYMNPRYNYSGNTAKLIGYEATATLTVSDLPIADLDEILSSSVDSGINTIQSITYMASDYDKGYQEALQKAMDTALQKAQALAASCGRNVGNAINITETSGYSQARYDDNSRSNIVNSMMKMEAAEDLAATAGIMPGEINVEASVTVEYQMY